MKALAALAMVLVLMVGGTAMAETLTRAEKMIPEEIAVIRAAEANVSEAVAQLDRCKKIIADGHGMKPTRWMEWSDRVAFDGDYILLYHTNMMDGLVWTNGGTR